jgi:hypothetical protein
LAQKHFCSNHCLNKYKVDIERKISLIKQWRNYFAPRATEQPRADFV